MLLSLHQNAEKNYDTRIGDTFLKPWHSSDIVNNGNEYKFYPGRN
jgi:hypothetical protein